jgi:hypothetical protein
MPWADDGGTEWNATKCSALDPDSKAPGEPCTAEGSGVSGVDDCEEGSMCWDVDPDTLQGFCVAFCIGTEANPSCADPELVCTILDFLPLCLP